MGYNPERINGLCYYNTMVACIDRAFCKTCGWSDEVRDRRIERIRATCLENEEKLEIITVKMPNKEKGSCA